MKEKIVDFLKDDTHYFVSLVSFITIVFAIGYMVKI